MAQGLADLYRDKGFLILKDFFTPESKARLKALGQSILQQVADGTISRSAQLTGPYDGAQLEFLKENQEILDLAEALLGPNIKFFQHRILLKDNSFGGMVPAHQDWPYFAGSPNKLNLFIPLTLCDEDRGPLVYYEGSHHMGPVDKGDIDVSRYPEMTPVTVSVDVGDLLATHFLAWHSSVPAKVPEPRLFIQFILADGDDPGTGYVLRGRNTNPYICSNFSEPMAIPHPSIHTGLARVLLQAGEVERAERLARGMLAVEGRNIDAAILLADIDKTRGGTGEAQLKWALERMDLLRADIEARLPAAEPEPVPEAAFEPELAPSAPKGLVGRLKGLIGV